VITTFGASCRSLRLVTVPSIVSSAIIHMPSISFGFSSAARTNSRHELRTIAAIMSELDRMMDLHDDELVAGRFKVGSFASSVKLIGEEVLGGFQIAPKASNGQLLLAMTLAPIWPRQNFACRGVKPSLNELSDGHNLCFGIERLN